MVADQSRGHSQEREDVSLKVLRPVSDVTLRKKEYKKRKSTTCQRGREMGKERNGIVSVGSWWKYAKCFDIGT